GAADGAGATPGEAAAPGFAMALGSRSSAVKQAFSSTGAFCAPRTSTVSTVGPAPSGSEEHTSELPSHHDLVCRLLLEKKKHTSELQSHHDLVCRLLLEYHRQRPC